MKIDLQLIREAYEHRKITDIVWITVESNPADALKKLKSNLALQKNFKDCAFHPEAEALIEHDSKPIVVQSIKN